MATTYQLGSVGKKAVLTKFYLVSDTATVGSSAPNQWEFMPKKNNATNLLGANKVTTGDEIVANAEYDLGTLLAAQVSVAATDTLQIEVTKTGAPTDLSGARIVFGWNGRVDLA